MSELPINAIIKFIDKDGNRWTAFAAVLPLKQNGTEMFCKLADAQSKSFRVSDVTYVETRG